MRQRVERIRGSLVWLKWNDERVSMILLRAPPFRSSLLPASGRRIARAGSPEAPPEPRVPQTTTCSGPNGNIKHIPTLFNPCFMSLRQWSADGQVFQARPWRHKRQHRQHRPITASTPTSSATKTTRLRHEGTKLYGYLRTLLSFIHGFHWVTCILLPRVQIFQY